MKLIKHGILKPSTVVHICSPSFQKAVGKNVVVEAILDYTRELSLGKYTLH